MTIVEINYTELDRTLFELIRRRLVVLDLLPDVTLYTTAEAFSAAKTAHTTAGKTLVEVFGTGSTASRDRKESHRIVINRKGTAEGTIGGRTVYYEPKEVEVGEPARFNKKRRPEETVMVNYEIRLVTNSTEVERKCSSAIFSALGIKRYVQMFNGNTFTNKSALLIFKGDAEVNSTDFIERLYMFGYLEIWLDNTSEDLGEVAALTDIQVSIGLLDTTGEKTSIAVEKHITQ